MTWSTNDEIKFINGLGHHRDRRKVPAFEEILNLLIGYRRGMSLRKVWTGMNPDTIRDYVENRIAYYESLIKKEKEQ